MNNYPKVNIEILVVKDNKILLGLLTKKWMVEGKQVYGVPGRDLLFKETIGDAIKRNIKEELNCEVKKYKVICVNANYAFGNHYIGIGVVASIYKEPINMSPVDWEKWEWFEKNKLPQNLFPSAQYIIQSYLENKVNVSE